MQKHNIEAGLRSMGLRMTRERELIVAEVDSFDGHFEPDELLDRMRRKNIRVSRASIYRTLPLLVECGAIKEAVYKDRKTRYERLIGRDHHDHMVCTECGGVIEFVSDEIERLQEAVCKRHGFGIAGHTLEIRGVCRDCSEGKTGASSAGRGNTNSDARS
ncbi:MAG: transcriptional repressor [Nitrospirae bacterium]|nr:transcriptional repressor [Nitrospirota bacterium]